MRDMKKQQKQNKNLFLVTVPLTSSNFGTIEYRFGLRSVAIIFLKSKSKQPNIS